MLELLFWSLLLIIVYTYIGYPCLLLILSLLKTKPVSKADTAPSVSIVITAYNEEKIIRDKIENSLSLDYPSGKLEIIVASDHSTDRTDEIVSEYAKTGVKLVRNSGQRGKEAAQNEAISHARGDILVLSDASIMIERETLRKMVSNFNDQSIGCVSSEDKIVPSDNTEYQGEGLYVKYEMFLRKLESKVNSLVGASGSLYAARRELCDHSLSGLSEDFFRVLSVARKGYRTIVEPEAFGIYKTVRSAKKEFRRKMRTVMRGMSALFHAKDMLNPFRYGFLSIQLISHKLLRWSVPWFMIGMAITNVFLIRESSFYFMIFLAQITFYVLAVVGHFLQERRLKTVLLKVPYFFCTVNLAILAAWWKYFSGKRYVTWEPSKRS